jgi:hypothetical protein
MRAAELAPPPQTRLLTLGVSARAGSVTATALRKAVRLSRMRPLVVVTYAVLGAEGGP